MKRIPTTLLWFRRNLRVRGNAAVRAAAARGLPAAGAYVFERGMSPRQKRFAYGAAAELHRCLAAQNIPLYVVGEEAEIYIPNLARQLNAACVLADEADTPQEREQDNRIWRVLDADGIEFERVADRGVFSKADLMAEHGLPFQDFASYRQAWRQAFAKLLAQDGIVEPEIPEFHRFQTAQDLPEMPDSRAIGAENGWLSASGETAAQQQWQAFAAELDRYGSVCSFPARKHSSSRLSAFLALGCISARQLAAEAWNAGADAWLDQLIRRDFYRQKLFHRPQTMPSENEALNDADGRIRARVWAWRQGQTGFPLIDAAMRCLNHTGWLHPILREAAAECCCAWLGLPWQIGAAWFAGQSADSDEAANIGNWQAAAECAVQTAIRAARPILQAQQLDPDGTFIRRYVPELAHLPKDVIHAPWLAGQNIDCNGYPPPIVDLLQKQTTAV